MHLYVWADFDIKIYRSLQRCARSFLSGVDFEAHQNNVIATHFSRYLMKSRRLCETFSFSSSTVIKTKTSRLMNSLKKAARTNG